jgi:photosystem II Psb27 protein
MAEWMTDFVHGSYGVKFPVPEKRRKRLLQEFNDIEKNIRKKR